LLKVPIVDVSDTTGDEQSFNSWLQKNKLNIRCNS